MTRNNQGRGYADRICGNCRYWEEQSVDIAPLGECRIHAPTVRSDDQVIKEMLGAWPITCEDDWCGQFADMPASAVLELSEVK